MARASVSPASATVLGPVRMCIGCRERVAASELVRVTAGSDTDGRAVAVPDPAGIRPGRGAHLHPTTGCYELAVRRRAFGRALRCGPALDSGPVAAYVASLASQTAPRDRPSDEELEQ